MEPVMDLYEINNRRQRWAALMLSSVALAASVAPRHERAIFQTDLTPPKALFASFPDEPGIVQLLGGLPLGVFGVGLPKAYLARLLPGPASPTPLAANPASAFSPLGNAAPFSSAPPLSTDAPFATPASPATPGSPIGSGPGASDSPIGSAFPTVPGAFGPPSTGPAVGPDVTTPGTPGVPGAPGTPGTPIVTVPVGPTVPAVPEPASWAMMLAGFLMVGVALRHRPRRGTASERPAPAQFN